MTTWASMPVPTFDFSLRQRKRTDSSEVVQEASIPYQRLSAQVLLSQFLITHNLTKHDSAD